MLALISSDVLKLRRRRGMLAISLLLTRRPDGRGVRRHGHPARRQPRQVRAGRRPRATTRTTSASSALMALIVGTIIGATAGTQDIESGVFRDLAATGRSRMALFASRVAGAWAVVLPILAVTGRARRRGLRRAGRLAGRPGRRRDRRRHGRRAGRRRAQRRGRGRRVRARRLARPGDRHHARVLPGGAEPAAGDGLPGRRAPDRPRRRDPRGSATSSRPRTCTSGWAPRSLVVIAWSAVTLGLGAWRTRTREI